MKKSIRFSALAIVMVAGMQAGVAMGEGEVHEVVIPEGKSIFTPEEVSIKAGDTVRWVNKDETFPSHDFASVPGPKPENKELKIIELKSGETYEHTFAVPGEYPYFCYIHKGMVGKIIVK